MAWRVTEAKQREPELYWEGEIRGQKQVSVLVTSTYAIYEFTYISRNLHIILAKMRQHILWCFFGQLLSCVSASIC